MSFKQITRVALAIVCLSSCSFSKSFYKPTKLDQNLDLITATDRDNKNDTILLHFAGSEHKLSMTDTKNNPKNLSYTISSHQFTSADGNNIYGWFVQPVSGKPARTTMLFLHGNGGNIIYQIPLVLALVKQGLQVFMVDYSGYGFSTGKPNRKHVLADADAALDYMLSMHGVTGTKIVVYGQSLGGHLSATVAMQNERKIDGLVMEGAFSTHKQIAAHMLGGFGFLAKILVKEQYTALRSIKNYHKPLLVIHSTEDEIVPFAMGKHIYDAANSPKAFYEIKHRHIQGPLFYADSIVGKINRMVGE